MKKSLLYTILILILSAALCCFVACSKGDSAPADAGEDIEAETDAEEEEDIDIDNADFNNPDFDNEQEGAEVTEEKAEQDTFYGSWSAKSGRAEYLYGNIDLTIKEDGTWEGNVTEEDYSGTWEYNGTGITLSSEIINCDLFVAQDGKVMFRDHDDPEDLLVLFKN